MRCSEWVEKLFDNNGLSELLGMIYDSVQAPARWTSVLERYSDVLRAKAASVNILDPVQGKVSLFVEHGTDPAWTALLMAKYAAMSADWRGRAVCGARPARQRFRLHR